MDINRLFYGRKLSLQMYIVPSTVWKTDALYMRQYNQYLCPQSLKYNTKIIILLLLIGSQTSKNKNFAKRCWLLRMYRSNQHHFAEFLWRNSNTYHFKRKYQTFGLLASCTLQMWINLNEKMFWKYTGLTTHSKNRATWLEGELRENLGDFRKSI